MAKLIGRMMYVGPWGKVYNFDAPEESVTARALMNAQQECEDPFAPSLGYYDDPLIVVPEALITNSDDLVFEDVEAKDVRAVVWTCHNDDGSTAYLCVSINNCYDAETKQLLAA
jgi:hypothetical protein